MAEDTSSSPGIPSALELIDLKAAAKWERSGRGGRPPHISSLCRWIQRGVRLRNGARLYLQAVRVPSGWRLSRQWLADFHHTLTADRLGRDIGAETVATTPTERATSTGRRSAAERRAASQRAAGLLEQMGC